ncbi:COP9/signalosome complex subunit Csn2 [Sugiyamaella lignohabitans]|uniref:COP9/signalosome complex subunit Csn2 n=1 Tax=Sugiyamaella lignohabitans TaxID=796027 RepID=A0A167BZV2_9ASCO|nr:COP9/signalosome complex subunit Csn2 [Sugiyamaella lignohabitans]ANB11034.1 COP9/signalosome complex subunit Csn2 [Sugiyamaella lignohabitans]
MTSPVITKNYAEKSLNNIIERITCDDLDFMDKIYTTTLDKLKAKQENDRLWIRTSLKLANLYISRELVDKAQDLVNELMEVCHQTNSGSDTIMSTYLLEIYALEIQVCMLTGNIKRLKELYSKTLNVTTAVLHPRILGVIRECGGKMHMQEKKWDIAREDFFESFKNYDEAGSLHRTQVLKYYVLACMLSESGINPFESQETKPYKDDPQVSVIVQLVDVFQKSDVEGFNELMKTHRAEIMSDSFFANFLDDIVLSIRSLGVLNLVKPYRRVSLDHIQNILGVDQATLVEIIVGLILDDRLPNTKIDLTNGFIDLNITNQSASVSSSKQDTRFSTSTSSNNVAPLPSRYYESDRDSAQQQEQQNLVRASSDAVAMAGLSSTSNTSTTTSHTDSQRPVSLAHWLGSLERLHSAIHA